MVDGVSEEQTLSDSEAERIWSEASTRMDEEAAEAIQVWGFDRLYQLADYFSQHTDKLNKTYPNWGASIERYRNLKPEAKRKFAEITDDFDRYSFLLDQARMITLLYPEEIREIYPAEKKAGSFPYLDSLLDTAAKMYHVPNMKGGDPFGEDWPTGTALNRYPFLERLTFGAKTSNETSGMFKAKMHPLRLRIK